MSNLGIFFVLTLLVCSLSEPVPSGTYCGSYLDTIQVTVKVISLQEASLSGTVFGLTLSCADEVVQYYANNHTVGFPDITKTSDCLGTIIRTYGQDPTLLGIVYHPNNDTITVTGGSGISFPMTKTCTFGKPSPTGAYCGSYRDFAKVRATIVNVNKTFAISGLSNNGKIFSCPHEPFTLFNNNTFFFPGAYLKDSCLGSIFAGSNVDPNSVSVVYNPRYDVATVFGPDHIQFELKSCPSDEYLEKVRKDAEPSGTYCGEYPDVATVNATVKTLTDVQLEAVILGSAVECKDEAVAYFAVNQSITFPHINDTNDCLGKALTSYGLDPSSISAVYAPATDTITVTAPGGISIDLTKSSCKTGKPERSGRPSEKAENYLHQKNLVYPY